MILPFRGIVVRLPYPETGLNTDRWMAEVTPARVLFGNLWLTQDHLRIMGVFGVPNWASANDPLPHAVFWQGELYLEDGHHRIVLAALRGETSALMRVFEMRQHGQRNGNREYTRTIVPNDDQGGILSLFKNVRIPE